MRHLHPFPARMAPELALSAMQGLAEGALILDPMVGSGTVLRNAAHHGFNAIGVDADPLAVLISRASSMHIDSPRVKMLVGQIVETARSFRLVDIDLPWIDGSEETRAFINFWFGAKQRNDLRKLAFAIHQAERVARNPSKKLFAFIKVALSRIIITKENGASLARDVSHSRPHKVKDSSDFDVVKAFGKSVEQMLRIAESTPVRLDGTVMQGDARQLFGVGNNSVDLVVTSPPYLNAIDYLRGHRLSLVWLGYGIDKLRRIRSESIGSERKLDTQLEEAILGIKSQMIGDQDLSRRNSGLIERYAHDIHKMTGEISRVLKPTGRAVLVVGDCNVQSRFVSNSKGIAAAAQLHGLRLESTAVRDLPQNNRYLPINTAGTLSRRMRTENVMTFSFT
jgi:SAM-dependent methyltransferase